MPCEKDTSERGELLENTAIAYDVLNRTLHHSHALSIRWGSYRLTEKRQDGLFRTYHLLGAAAESDNDNHSFD